MECLHCRGNLTRKNVSYTANRMGYHLVIDNVPAWVCEQCSEPMFDEETVQAIQAMLYAVDTQREKFAMPFAVA